MLRQWIHPRSPGHRLLQSCRATVVGTAFWAAVLFPVLHVFLAIRGGYTESPVLPWLVGAHALALVIGHHYTPVEQPEHAGADESVGV